MTLMGRLVKVTEYFEIGIGAIARMRDELSESSVLRPVDCQNSSYPQESARFADG
jgi:hypothetical protein